ncbi:MAG: GNAT family N-acetyltransferase [Planctomycetes bacterium]|nr:GNAT family N-acetyltransferase [Planctomycetota bacterium]
MSALTIDRDAWLSTTMGREVFRMEVAAREAGRGLTGAELGELEVHARRGGPAMYFAKVGTQDVGIVRDLSRAGFYVVDVSVTFALEAGAMLPAGRLAADIGVSQARREEAEAVLAIAGSCFRYSRFHQDPALPRELADRVKREWIANYVRGARGDALLAGRSGSIPAGFLAALRTREDSREVAVIDLVGVDPRHQGRGVGRALVDAFLARYSGSCHLFRVGTQAANVPSIRLYEGAGFRVERCQYVLHRHVGAKA